MDQTTKTASALLWALGLAREYGGAAAALAAVGNDLSEVERFEGMSREVGELLGRQASDAPVREAVALGVLAGRVAHQHPRPRRLQDPTSFLMDPDLVVRAAEGQSVMRLPWFEEGLFIGRQVPDISEMPANVRRLCIEHYSAALAGERVGFTFTSYGHAYSIDAVPVQGEGGCIEAVLAIATPARWFRSAVIAYERTAQRLEHSARLAEQRAERFGAAGNEDAARAERRTAHNARQAAERVKANARQLYSRDAPDPADPPAITSRETEVVTLASYGLTSAEIAEQLGVSVGTVKTHFDNLYARLGVSDRAAAVACALRHGLIQ